MRLVVQLLCVININVEGGNDYFGSTQLYDFCTLSTEVDFFSFFR
jgi:hypothetical protein